MATRFMVPDPSTHTDGTDYNVFNLDPFVWFVHQKLGLSGYGFSFDDDVSDVGAGGQAHFPSPTPPARLQIPSSLNGFQVPRGAP